MDCCYGYAAAMGHRLIIMEEATEVYRTLRAHLNEVANHLTRADLFEGRARNDPAAGAWRAPEGIRLGNALAASEPDFAIFESL